MLPLAVWDHILNRAPQSVALKIAAFRRLNPELLESIGRRKALALFHKASRLVPAYRDFLAANGVDPRKVRTFGDFEEMVPFTSKENYVKKYPLAARCVLGRLPGKGTMDESAGTCASPTNWVHSIDEEDFYFGVNRLSIPYLFSLHRGSKSAVFINGYAMGAWAGGQKFSSRMSALGLVVNTGPEAGKIISIIREAGPGFRYIVSGYPPFLRELADELAAFFTAGESGYQIDLLTGGEGFAEEWRDYMRGRLGKGARIFSIYGASDLDVGIAMETPVTICLRKMLNARSPWREALFATDCLPCFLGQYSPANFLVGRRSNSDGRYELEVTVLNLRSASPKIRYNIEDEGGVIPFSVLKDFLAAQDCPLRGLVTEKADPPVAPLAFLFLFGRTDGTIFFDGTMISPLDVEALLFRDPELSRRLHSFKMAVEMDANYSQSLVLHFEMAEGASPDEALRLRAEKAFIAGIKESNCCFRMAYERNPERLTPRILFHGFGSGMFAAGRLSGKQQRIVRA